MERRQVVCIVKVHSRGMKTIYIKRSTEDPDENMEQLETEFDLFLDGTIKKPGLLELAALWDEVHA